MLCVQGYVLVSIKYSSGIPRDNDETVSRWQREIPKDGKANLVIFGEEKPTVKSLKLRLVDTLENAFHSSHLWRDEPKPETLVGVNPEFRLDLVTQRGCIAIAFPYMDINLGPFLGSRA